jgi:hypothetical protein
MQGFGRREKEYRTRNVEKSKMDSRFRGNDNPGCRIVAISRRFL